MKQKNAIIGTKVKVKVGAVHSGCIGTIVDFSTFGSSLVQFDTKLDRSIHSGSGLTKSGNPFPNSRYYAASDLKRIKE